MQAVVVDDSRAMRMLLGRQLETLNFEVLYAADGIDCLDLLEGIEILPCLVLIDWNMPNMDGLQLVGEIRKSPSWRDITLMMVTTESEQTQIVRALAAGAHEYLIKPFTVDALTEKLSMLGLVSEGAGV